METISIFLLYLAGKFLLYSGNLILYVSATISEPYFIFGFLGFVVMFCFYITSIMFIPILVFVCSAKPITNHTEGN